MNYIDKFIVVRCILHRKDDALISPSHSLSVSSPLEGLSAIPGSSPPAASPAGVGRGGEAGPPLYILVVLG